MDQQAMGLDELLNILHKTQGDIVGRSLEIAFGIDPDNGLCVGCTQMHPIIIEFYLQSIIGIDGMILILSFDLIKDGIDIDPILQLDLILGNKIIRIA
jgi:hypothetical protein